MYNQTNYTLKLVSIIQVVSKKVIYRSCFFLNETPYTGPRDRKDFEDVKIYRMSYKKHNIDM